ncbi:DUF418 domain-containing protein [Metabacillus arenae]|uniref:DUF418 domain-containing protein n=1 Tax=Metabacillus arenae TaxID=2771434 RepID=A0A926RXF4_9BACI|nr:DUF418 domain-containing protein [Metabacillus arenae]MBD1380615.1 DUF418 domain-containing protein [Metabacillus arenae]
MEKFEQITSSKRISSLDVLRGLALLGILFVNMRDFSGPLLYMGKMVVSLDPLNNFVEKALTLFVQASFYPLFAFLFGAGTIIFYERAKEKEIAFGPLYLRRLLGLGFFGMIHAFFIWHGDILITYAVTGLFMFFFLKSSPLALLGWSIGLFLVPNLIFNALLFLTMLIDPSSLSVFANEEEISQAIASYQQGSYWEVANQRIHDWLYVNNLFSAPFLILSILPMFLFGAYAFRSGWFDKEGMKKIHTKWVLIITGGLAVLLKGIPYITVQNALTEQLQLSVGGPVLTVFYVAGFLVLYRNGKVQKALRFFAAVGKASLSNYLLQSIICTMLFYSYGIGLYNQISTIVGMALTLIIFAGQILISNLWFSKFKSGPAEWLWRKFIYLR